jgi:3-deoxy-D-manno-octulosonic acid (KDO) 8-phosphate synthase
VSDVLDDPATADVPDRDDTASNGRRRLVAPLVVGAIAVLMVGLFVVLAGASPTAVAPVPARR